MLGLLSRNCMRRLLALCIIHFSLYLSALASVEQGKKKITLVAKDMPWKQVSKSIRAQTGMTFFFTPLTAANIPEKVTISANAMALDEVLTKIFQGTNLEWVYMENNIVLRPKESKQESTGMVRDSSINSVTVTGKVVAQDGTPIPGATVIVKNTNDGTLTDENGNFTLTVKSKNKTLLIRSVGFDSREIVLTENSVLIKLAPALQSIEETVVKGYYTTTKRLNTGNVTTIGRKEIELQPISNTLSALQGRVPGMFITQKTGVSGGGFDVQIRGANSIKNGTDPFYVVDGVPYTSQLLPNLGGNILQQSNSNFSAGSGNPLSFINPSDIESITILKDADATAIYGSRGANGVVLITTKKGNPGKTKATINIASGLSQIGRRLNLLKTKEYLTVRREAFANDSQLPTSTTAPDLFIWDTTISKDWQKEMIGHTGHYTDIYMSLSGGSENTQYLLGSTLHKESTVFPGTFSDNKGSIHISLNSKSVNEKFRFTLTTNYLIDNNNLPSTELTRYIFLPPNAPDPLTKDNTLNWADGTWPNGINPLYFTKQPYKSNTYNLVSNLNLSYYLVKGLKVVANFGYTNMQSKERLSTPISSLNPASSTKTGRSSFTDNSIRSWIIEPQLVYDHKIGKGLLNVLLGTTFQKNNNEGEILNGSGYTSDALLDNIQAASKIEAKSVSDVLYKYSAIFSRINYNWKDKYILNLTIRRDGSSRFGENNRFHNFGSVGAAWLFSEEPFLKKASGPLTYGKFRASYGLTGNDQIGDYSFYDLYSTNSYAYQGVVGLSPLSLYNPYLAWEETKKTEAGLELGFINDRFLINISYYQNRSSNQLLSYNLPLTTGFQSVSANFPATIVNKGWEFSISTANISKDDFEWKTSLNFTIPKNWLKSFPNINETTYQYTLLIGQPISIIKAYHLNGVSNDSGLYEFTDAKGNATNSPITRIDNFVPINTMPKYYGGISNSIRYKNFSFDILLQYTNQIGSNPNLQQSPPGYFGVNISTENLDRWKSAGDHARFQQYTQSYSSTAYLTNLTALQSDYAYTNATFLRLKSASISYNASVNWLHTLRLQGLRIYMQGLNLLTITKYKGLDPETQSFGTLPPLRTITAGIDLSL